MTDLRLKKGESVRKSGDDFANDFSFIKEDFNHDLLHFGAVTAVYRRSMKVIPIQLAVQYNNFVDYLINWEVNHERTQETI
ncbi:hypothetical protein [Limosilactobacillus oris]|uniref:hypothetical protein n=1 Tax=Limosilactobacillus oris TaxID=1632 RepID=UPI00159DF8CC|nr:hypothetical protein [Limosilactobacillus oris]